MASWLLMGAVLQSDRLDDRKLRKLKHAEMQLNAIKSTKAPCLNILFSAVFLLFVIKSVRHYNGAHYELSHRYRGWQVGQLQNKLKSQNDLYSWWFLPLKYPIWKNENTCIVLLNHTWASIQACEPPNGKTNSQIESGYLQFINCLTSRGHWIFRPSICP